MICIYAIINIVDDKLYIGQTSDKDYRWQEHRKQLRGFYHHSILLQRAWCKHSEQNFIFVVLEVLPTIELLNEKEQLWADLLKPEYNIAPAGGSMRGYKHSKEAKANMSKAHKGHKHTEEFKRDMSERLKGNQFNTGRKQTKEHIEARAKYHRGKTVSDETKAKMSASLKGRTISEETRQKMAAAKIGKKLSDNHKQKLSIAARNQWWNGLTEFKN